jgi:GH3 auxin-responsive promoter
MTRCLADALFRRRARRRLGRLDETSAFRAQSWTLLELVRRAQQTRFGCEHDFGRVRTPEDFRRLVPLRTATDLWQQYGSPSVPLLDGAAWPGPISFLATCESVNQSAPPLAVSAELVKAHRDAAWTALAFVLQARPQARLLSGSLLLVGGGAALTPVKSHASDNLEELARGQVPWLLRPYTIIAPYSGETPLRALAERAAGMPVTCLAGNAGRLRRVCQLVREHTGRDDLASVWPSLTAVLYARGPGDPGPEDLAPLIGCPRGGEPVRLLETCVRPEGVFAIEDPRPGRLRFIPDHGVYFEFVPLDDVGGSRPGRVSLGEVSPGVPYALAVTSPAGLWACLTGLTVTFERTDPPLVRSIEAGLSVAPRSEILPLRPENPPPGVVGIPRPRSAGMGAGPARRFSRNPWSGRADQR